MPIYKIDGKKKDGLQKYRVVVNYTEDGGGKRTKERLVYGKAQAELAEAAIRDSLRARRPEPETKKTVELTFSKLFERYKKDRGGEIRASTMAKKESIVKNHLEPVFGPLKLSEITRERIMAWRADLNADPMKVNTKNGIFRELRALMNYAAAHDLIPKSPLAGIKPFRDAYKETASVKIRYYTKEEYGKFIGEVKKRAERIGTVSAWGAYAFFRLAYLTGARKGEINALRWSDIDGTFLWVRRSVTQKLKGEKWVETPPKNESSVRRLRMPEQLVKDLDEHRERQKEAGGWNESLFICGGENPIPDTTIEKINGDCAKAAGVKKITIHEFRHSHASLLCNAGVNIKEIARRLGHADVEITLKTYAHLYPTEEERAVSVLTGI